MIESSTETKRAIKGLFIVLCIIMLFTLLPVNVSAEEYLNDDQRKFEITFKTGIGQGDMRTSGDVWLEFVYATDDYHLTCKPFDTTTGKSFENGTRVTYSLNIYKDPLKKVIIHHKGDGWKLDYVEFDGARYWINEWLYDSTYEIDVTAEPKVLDSNPHRITIKTGNWEGGKADVSVYVQFYFCDKNDPKTITAGERIKFDRDYFPAGSEQELVLYDYVPEDKEIAYVDINHHLNWGNYYWKYDWDLEWVKIDDGEQIPVNYTLRASDTWSYRVFPNVGYSEKQLIFFVGSKGTNRAVFVNFKFADDSETGYLMLPLVLGGISYEFKSNTSQQFFINLPNKPVKEILIKYDASKSSGDYWDLEKVIFDRTTYEIGDKLSYANWSGSI